MGAKLSSVRIKFLTNEELDKLPSPRLFDIFNKISAIECKILNKTDRSESYTDYKLRVKNILDGRKWNKNANKT